MNEGRGKWRGGRQKKGNWKAEERRDQKRSNFGFGCLYPELYGVERRKGGGREGERGGKRGGEGEKERGGEREEKGERGRARSTHLHHRSHWVSQQVLQGTMTQHQSLHGGT